MSLNPRRGSSSGTYHFSGVRFLPFLLPAGFDEGGIWLDASYGGEARRLLGGRGLHVLVDFVAGGVKHDASCEFGGKEDIGERKLGLSVSGECDNSVGVSGNDVTIRWTWRFCADVSSSCVVFQ